MTDMINGCSAVIVESVFNIKGHRFCEALKFRVNALLALQGLIQIITDKDCIDKDVFIHKGFYR